MAAHVPTAPGYLQMLASGARYFSGPEEVVFRNIEACGELARSLRATFGPGGLNKLVVSRLQEVLVTGDVGTVLRELEVEQPAARLLVLAVGAQEAEAGDGRCLVLLLAGALLERAGGLLRAGISPAQVAEGYRQACRRALGALEGLCRGGLPDRRDPGEVARAVRAAVGAKLPGYEGPLSRLVAEACVAVAGEGEGQGGFDPEAVRLCKVLGAGVGDSAVLAGLAFKREAEGRVTAVRGARVAVYSCAFELPRTEAKGTALVRGAEGLRALAQGEERATEDMVRGLAEAGGNVVVAGGKVGDLALQFADERGLMVVRLPSRQDLARLGRALGVSPLAQLRPPPTPAELGPCERVELREVGGTQLVVFERHAAPVRTVVLRGSSRRLQDHVAEAVRDGVSAYRTLSRDGRVLPGAGATEMELARQLSELAQSCPGLEQYVIREFAGALESVAEALVQSAGDVERQSVAKLRAAHQMGGRDMGFDLEAGPGGILDAAQAGIWDPLLVKRSALELATNAAVTVLSVDQIIMAKKSGGPKPRGENPNWDLPPDHID